MRPGVIILWCLMLGASLTAHAVPLSVEEALKKFKEAEAAYGEATEAEIKYRVNRVPAGHGRTGKPFPGDPLKWNPTTDRELSIRTDVKAAELEKAERELARARAAEKAERAARAAAAGPKKDMGRIPPPKPPELKGPLTKGPPTTPHQTLGGPLTKGPKTIPDIGDTFPGPIDPHDPWPFPWKKPKC